MKSSCFSFIKKHKFLTIVFGIALSFAIALSIASVLRPKISYIDTTNEEYKDLNPTEQRAAFIRKNLLSGGPEKDGIPALQDESLNYIDISKSQLDDEEVIFGINYNGLVAAYPRNIMFWHEIVNEVTKDGEEISITYCPLTQSVIGYRGYNFGVSGKLFNSNLVVYDRKTDAYLPQIEAKFINTDLLGQSPQTFEVFITTLSQWREKYPKSLILTEETGHYRDYTISPYQRYYDNLYNIWFPLEHKSDALRPKDIVFFIQDKDQSFSFLKENFRENFPNGKNITLGNKNIFVSWDDSLGVIVTNEPNIRQFESFWFAVHAFYPKTKLVNP